jgi:N-acetylmuramic acid 6-phosphate etherase
MKYLGLDIGGTWIKGTIVDDEYFRNFNRLEINQLSVNKIESKLHKESITNDLLKAILKLIDSFHIETKEIGGIGISTPGIVNYAGSKVLAAASHLNVLKNDLWQKELSKKIKCNSILINDSDAATIGLSQNGYLSGDKSIGIMPVGTGVGFTVWRNGRRWRPGKIFTLLGSIIVPGSNYDSLVSASRLAELDVKGNLINILIKSEFKKDRESYFEDLANVLNTAAIIYNLDEVIVCGGLADASNTCGFPLERILNELLLKIPVPVERDSRVNVVVPVEGNQLQLIGALTLAKAESIAQKNKIVFNYNELESEKPYNDNLQLQELNTYDIVKTLWQAEQESGELLKNSLHAISEVIEIAIPRIRSGGRIIYVGAGTSGRIAAIDAVEIPCTYGLAKDKILTVIAGGISDSAIEIESDFEEDVSSLPEMLLLNIHQNDVVIGISASGMAYFVQSALSYAKYRGAVSILLHNNSRLSNPPFCEYLISLNSGNEVVSGSTRMKAGTSTKKVLNFISTAIMIKLGKVQGSFMIDVACTNNKLIERAKNILMQLYKIDEKQAQAIMERTNMSLKNSIKEIEKNNNIKE